MIRFASVFTAALFTANAAFAADYILTLKGEAFEPATLEIPANEKVKLIVKNENAKPAEFESHDLKREKIIGANSQAVINIGPLKPGSYVFFDEFQEDKARGAITVK